MTKTAALVLSALSLLGASASRATTVVTEPSLNAILLGVEGGAWSNVTSSFDFSALGTGWHVFEIAGEYTSAAHTQAFKVGSQTAFGGSADQGDHYAIQGSVSNIKFATNPNSYHSAWSQLSNAGVSSSVGAGMQVWKSATGNQYAFAYEDWGYHSPDYNDFVVTINVLDVPEPSQAAMLGLGRLRRRRERAAA
jgi:hypothetical protein